MFYRLHKTSERVNIQKYLLCPFDMWPPHLWHVTTAFVTCDHRIFDMWTPHVWHVTTAFLTCEHRMFDMWTPHFWHVTTAFLTCDHRIFDMWPFNTLHYCILSFSLYPLWLCKEQSFEQYNYKSLKMVYQLHKRREREKIYNFI